MDGHVKIPQISFGERVFIHRNGTIREAEYRGIIVKYTSDLRNDTMVEYIFWFGSKLDENKINTNISLYKTAEDATWETNPILFETLDMESFSLRFLPHLIWNGIQFCGWLWDGSRPIKKATREPLRICEIRNENVVFIDYNGNIYDAEHFQRFYQTAEKCRKENKPKIVMLDEEEDDSAKQKRDEFYKYVKHHCPGFEDKIDWKCFREDNTMPWNLSQQVKSMYLLISKKN